MAALGDAVSAGRNDLLGLFGNVCPSAMSARRTLIGKCMKSIALLANWVENACELGICDAAYIILLLASKPTFGGITSYGT